MADEDTTCGQRMGARCSAFGKFLYNSEDGKIIGRTPKSWALITIFYLIYYSCLAGFFVGMLSVLLYGVISDTEPRLTGDHSLLRLNPGLAMRPQPDVLTTLIDYDMKKPESYEKFTSNIQKLADEFKNNTEDATKANVTLKDCDLSNAEANSEFNPTKEICKTDVDKLWVGCAPSKLDAAYKNGTPCVIVKMNKIYGWLPDIENAGNNHTLLKCEGENDGDKPNIGDVEYFPNTTLDGEKYGYFSSALFPYLNQPGYTTPTVAVKFNSIRHNVLVMVECRLYNLKNSQYDKMDKAAMVRFELVVYNHN